MIDEGLQKLIEFLQEASPLVWQAVIKQAYVESLAKIAWAIVFAFGSLVSFRLFKKGALDELGINEILPMVATLLGLISLWLFTSAAMWLSNPEFYAIRFLIEKLSGE